VRNDPSSRASTRRPFHHPCRSRPASVNHHSLLLMVTSSVSKVPSCRRARRRPSIPGCRVTWTIAASVFLINLLAVDAYAQRPLAGPELGVSSAHSSSAFGHTILTGIDEADETKSSPDGEIRLSSRELQ